MRAGRSHLPAGPADLEEHTMPDETLIELPDFALDWRDTPRGFMRADFVDTYRS